MRVAANIACGDQFCGSVIHRICVVKEERRTDLLPVRERWDDFEGFGELSSSIAKWKQRAKHVQVEDLPDGRVDLDDLLVELGLGGLVHLRLLGVNLLQDEIGEVLLLLIVGGEEHIQSFLKSEINRESSTSSSSSM